MSPPERIPLRWRAWAFAQKVWRWEFWPRQVFYLPLVPLWGVLLLKHRGRLVFTATNPGIPHSGVLGESKFDTLEHIPADLKPDGVRLPATDDASPGSGEARVAPLMDVMRQRGWSFPIILKPDAGERGRSVKLACDEAAARAALEAYRGVMLAQVYHPGPMEAGVFYVREPGQERGRVFSITLKDFPEVIGDGRSTVRRLIWAHPRYRLQASRFLARLREAADRVPAPGERVRLGIAGNHCQGTLFRDGAKHITPGLEAAIERAARAIPGFHFGRFDIRFATLDDLEAGRGLAIIEANGVLAESTNIYDPTWPLWRAYATLYRQWRLACRIGTANARNGARLTPTREILRTWREHVRTRADDLSD